mgnify:CR=1 FL=1
MLFSPCLLAQKIEKYIGSVTIDMAGRTYRSSLDIYFSSYAESDTVKLYIQGGAEITSVKSGASSISYKTTDEELVYDSRKKQILIPIDNITHKKISISYANSFDEIKNKRFQYKPDWTEFNIYTDWFPWNIAYGLFHYDLKINTTDSVIGANLSENNVLKSTNATFDMSFLVSSKAQRKTTKNGKINIYYHQVADTIINSIQEKSEQFFSYYEQTYGPADTDELVIVVSDSKRSLSYARPNFISLNFDEQFTKTHIKTLAHEIAHLWWLKADLATWEDWLNEAFAEYSAYVVYRTEYGKDAYDDYIQKIENWLQKFELPTLWEIEKSHSESNRVLTYKGALYLCELENRIGIEKMEALLKEMHGRKIVTTTDFLDLLTELTDPTTSSWFEEQLKK